jgi:hypothetical protein
MTSRRNDIPEAGAPTGGLSACPRCTIAHHPRLPCADGDLSRRSRDDQSFVAPKAERPPTRAVVRRAVVARVVPTPTSFGWKGRVVLTVLPYLFLMLLARVMNLGTALFMLTVGAPLLVFTLWWTKRVWDSPRRR